MSKSVGMLDEEWTLWISLDPGVANENVNGYELSDAVCFFDLLQHLCACVCFHSGQAGGEWLVGWLTLNDSSCGIGAIGFYTINILVPVG